jgi:hypothetical protein
MVKTLGSATASLRAIIAVLLLAIDQTNGEEFNRLAAQIATHYEDDTRAGGLKFETTFGGSTPTERMRLTGTGRLAIGTSDPNAMLHVNGKSTPLTPVLNEPASA